MPEQMTPEQVKALEEKIKSMSPEELREFQKKQCIFCQIIQGKVQSKKVYEDEHVIAVLDINPANPGHMLLLTKEHYSIMPQVPDEEMSHLAKAIKMLSNSLLKSLGAQGTNVIIANGVAAGQRAQHFMAHIIPRKENDGVKFELPQRPMQQEVIDNMGDRIVQALKIKSEPKSETIEQKETCLVCNIISGKIPSKKVHEDEKTITILDVNGSNPGHCFVMTKNHYPIIEHVPDSELSIVFENANKVLSAIFEALQSEGTNLFIANGVPAGQTTAHFMVNLIPRMQNDGINLQWKPKQLDEEEISTVELKLKEQIGKLGVGSVDLKETRKKEFKERKYVSSKENKSILTQITRIP